MHRFNLITYYIAVVLLQYTVGCSTSNQQNYERLIEEWAGRQIAMPDVMTDFISGDTIDLSDADYIIFTYVDSVGCSECRMRLDLWNIFFDRLDSVCPDNIRYQSITIVNKTINPTLPLILKRHLYQRPIFVDSEDIVSNDNRFSDDMMFHTFLLDNNKNVVLIGNPVYNSKIADLYISQISGKDVSGVNKDAIYIHSPSHDFGSVLAGDTVRHTFSITNPGKDTIKILKIIPSCECTTAQPSDTIIAPKQSVDIYVTFSDSTETGDLYRTVDIMFDKYDRPLQIEIFANVYK